jgi:hypothetical protein
MVINATSEELVRMLSRRDNKAVSPAFLRWLYRTQTYVPAATRMARGQNVLGILGLGNEYPGQEDLTGFMTDYCRDAAASTRTFTVAQVNGGGYYPSHPNVDIHCSTPGHGLHQQMNMLLKFT